MNDKEILSRSHAGMRLIALASLYNRQDFTRVRAYLKDHFSDAALEQAPVALRIAEMRELLRAEGKVRVHQVIAHDPHHVVVLMATEQGGLVLEDLTVETEYPHKVSRHIRQPVA